MKDTTSNSRESINKKAFAVNEIINHISLIMSGDVDRLVIDKILPLIELIGGDKNLILNYSNSFECDDITVLTYLMMLCFQSTLKID